MANPAGLLRWNSDKHYLQALEGSGVPIVPTRFVDRASPAVWELCAREGWDDVVIKPAVGASAHGARRFRGTTLREAAQGHANSLLEVGAIMVQPFQSAVETDLERSLVFLDGCFSHAFLKPAFSTAVGGPRSPAPSHRPTATELALASSALKVTPGRSTYARVDLVPSSSGPVLMELELIEPDLGLRFHSGALSTFAKVCLRLTNDAELRRRPHAR